MSKRSMPANETPELAYRVARVLNAGGFGVTYLREHGELSVQVAVKERLPHEITVCDRAEVYTKSAGDQEGFEWALNRLLDEARTLPPFASNVALDHTSIAVSRHVRFRAPQV